MFGSCSPRSKTRDKMSAWTEEERAEALRRRMEGGAMAPASLSAGGLKFVSKGDAKVSDTGTLIDDFIEAETFDGEKAGYVFKMGRQGLGYYADLGPMKAGEDGCQLNDAPAEYDMEKHARGETDDAVPEPPEPGEGRVGALGDLLAENKAKKQEHFEKMVHDNRFQPPRALDDDEADFLAQKERERADAQRARKEFEKEAETAFKIAQQEAENKVEKAVDLTKIMGAQKTRKADNKQSSILSKMIASKRKPAEQAEQPPDKKPKSDQGGGGNALMGLGAYDDSDEDEDG